MSESTAAFQKWYAAAFRSYLLDGSESTLRTAYELGRDAVGRGLGVLDLAVAHHEVLLDELRRASDGAELEQVTHSAAAFFLESLSAFEMVQRGFREAHEAALLERRHALILRQLSNLLADASLALAASDSLEEMLQLVAEQARELIGSDCCLATVSVGEAGRKIEAASYRESDTPWASPATSSEDLARDAGVRAFEAGSGGGRSRRRWLEAPLTSLDGRDLGSIRLAGKRDGDFTEVDEAVLVHLAQMASAALERTRLYRRRA